MTGAELIVGIVDAAQPLPPVEISEAAATPREAPARAARQASDRAPRQRRGRSSSSSTDDRASADPPGLPAGHPREDASSHPPGPSHAAGASTRPQGAASGPAAVPPSAASAVLASSQSGGSPREDAPAEEGGDDALQEALLEARHREEELRRDALHRELAELPTTDIGNAERFRARYGHLFRFCPTIGWFAWDERRWVHKGAEERLHRAVHETVRAIQDEARACFEAADELAEQIGAEGMAQATAKPKTGKRKRETEAPEPEAEPEPAPIDERTARRFARWKHLRALGVALAAWGRDSEMNPRLGPIEKHAAPYLAVDIDALDADPWRLNVLNGTLVFDRAADGYIRFQAHDPADLITKLAPVNYDPAATCGLFDDFLAYVQPKAENRRFLLTWMGYSLTADVSEQQLCLFYGKGKNGKSVFVEACAHVAGDYSETVPIETFLSEGRSRNAGQATPDLAILPGVRMLRTSEPDRGAKLAEALIKLATGGEPVLARHLNRDYFKFYPSFKLTISGNYRPQIVGTDEGIWRRVKLVPWAVTVPPEKRDKDLPRKLRAEASGILNRLLDGLRDYLDCGLVSPGDVDEATAEYRSDSDPCGRFLEACVAPDPEGKVQSSRMHEVYKAWAACNGAPEWSNKGLSNALTERGFRKKQSDVMWWIGVKLIRDVNDFVDSDGKPLTQSGGGGSRGDGVSPAADDWVVT